LRESVLPGVPVHHHAKPAQHLPRAACAAPTQEKAERQSKDEKEEDESERIVVKGERGRERKRLAVVRS
jgi:hypothetical protein